jgi:long-subunit acyl-CoA synthetase (AMP-forming)
MKHLNDLIEQLAEPRGKPAVLALKKEGLEKWAYRDLAESVQRTARQLLKHGLSDGEAVAVQAAPGPCWIAGFSGLGRAGAV